MVQRRFNAEGGHFEQKGLFPDDSIQPVLLHRHEVKLDVVRFNVGLKYQISQQWRLEAALPYEIKSQDASVPDIDSVDDPDQKDAILRYQNIHHRNQTYRGISDIDLLLGYSKQWNRVEKRYVHGETRYDDSVWQNRR